MNKDLQDRLAALLREAMVKKYGSVDPGDVERLIKKMPGRYKKQLAASLSADDRFGDLAKIPGRKYSPKRPSKAEQAARAQAEADAAKQAGFVRRGGRYSTIPEQGPIPMGGMPRPQLPTAERKLAKPVDPMDLSGGGQQIPGGRKKVKNRSYGRNPGAGMNIQVGPANQPRLPQYTEGQINDVRRMRAQYRINNPTAVGPGETPIPVGGTVPPSAPVPPNEGNLLQRVFRKHPVGAIVGSVGTAAWLADLAINEGPDLWDRMTGATFDRELTSAITADIEGQRRAAELERLQNQISLNTARLAAGAPHLYNEVLAGRTLPQGAVVLGGQPRTDLLNQLALGMSQGQYSQGPTEQDRLTAMLQ